MTTPTPTDLWSYDWLPTALRERDSAVEAFLVVAENVRLVVAVRGDRFTTMPLEGRAETSIEILGGVRSVGFFALNAESDAVRAAFVERVLQSISSPASPRQRPSDSDFIRRLFDRG